MTHSQFSCPVHYLFSFYFMDHCGFSYVCILLVLNIQQSFIFLIQISFLSDLSYCFSFTPGAEDQNPESLFEAPKSQVSHLIYSSQSTFVILFIILFFNQLSSENTFCQSRTLQIFCLFLGFFGWPGRPLSFTKKVKKPLPDAKLDL